MYSKDWDMHCIESELATLRAENKGLRELVETLCKDIDKKNLMIEELQVENLQLKMVIHGNQLVME